MCITVVEKTPLNIQDDLYLTVKNKLQSFLPGNNNALFIGRLQPPTKAHMEIIRQALNTYDGLTIALVKGKKSEQDKNPFPFELQEKMIHSVFPDVKIIQIQTGNLIHVISKSPLHINTILAGSDRVEGYKKQLERSYPDVKITEIPRTNEDVSATKVRNALLNNDIVTFKDNMDINHWKYFDELQKYVKQNEKLKTLLNFELFEKILYKK